MRRSQLLKELKPFFLRWLKQGAEAGLTVGEGPGIDLVGPTVGLGGDTVLLYDAGGDPVREYAADATGLAAALAAMAAGDVVRWYAGTITGNFTVPAGGALMGIGPNSIINGYVTVLGKLLHCTVYQSVNTSADAVNVIADAGAYLSHVDITLIQAGTGKALGLLGIAEALEAPADAYDCNINVQNSGGGSAWDYAGTVEGNVRLHQGSVVGLIVGA